MGPVSQSAPFLQHQNMVRAHDRADALGDHDTGGVRKMLPQLSTQRRVGPVVQRAGRIVQYQDLRACKLGFRTDQILMHNLSADVGLFSRIDINSRAVNYPKRLLYVGRFSPEKGLVYLLKAWQSVSDRKGWQLTLVGNGPEKEKLTGYPDVEILDFMDQQELLKVMENSGAFILPSVSEPWALVIHEATCAGLPVLASDCCGAITSFLKEGENGYLFVPGNIRSIRHSIEKLLIQSEADLLQMGRNSRVLGKQITPERVADTLLTVLK